jgi:hypothetical protein
MIRRLVSIAALATLSAVVTASSASAGGALCCCLEPCVVAVPPPVVVYKPYELPRIYVVDQGPVYSGPGIYTEPTLVLPRPMARYPYIGRGYRAPLRVRY